MDQVVGQPYRSSVTSGLRGPAGRLLGSALRPERRTTATVVAVLMVAVLLRLAMPVLLGRFVDNAVSGRPLDTVTTVAVLYILAALAAEGLQLTVIWGAVNLSWRAGNRLREQLARHALALEMRWHAKHSPGQLIERIDGDVEALVVFFAEVLVNVVGSVVLVAGMLVVAFVIDWRSGVVLLISAAASLAVMVRLRVAAVPAREAEREANAVMYGDLEERLGGLEDLRANGAGGFAVHKLHLHSAVSWRTGRRAALLGDGAHALAAMAQGLGSAAILALGIVLHQRGAVSVGAVVTLFRYAEMLRQPLERIAEQLKEFQKAVAGARRAATLLATAPAIVDGPLGPDALAPGPLSVEFDRVRFAYEPGESAVLDGVDLSFPAGLHVGVVGRTGSGKTTLGRLLLRFWDVDAGAVRIGGVDVRDLRLDALRDRVAVVTQDVELFRATLRDNLTLFTARPVDDARLVAVLERVDLGRWLAAQPAGLDTFVEGAGSLSAGEAQLLALARAFLTDPAVVVLDEASSRLDPATEARVTAATRALMAGRTALVIAHRLATLDDMDHIVVVDHGQVVEHGERRALAGDASSRYATLLRRAAATGDPDADVVEEVIG